MSNDEPQTTILIRCVRCDTQFTDARNVYDPAFAVVMHILCKDCTTDKDDDYVVTWFDEDGCS